MMTKKRYRDFPVIDKKGRFTGFISRRRLLKPKRKQVVLVDHMKKPRRWTVLRRRRSWKSSIITELAIWRRWGRFISGTSRLAVQRRLFIRCTRKIRSSRPKRLRELLCAAILSDTLLFQSPTCTPMDEATARTLAKIAQIDVVEICERDV